MRRRTKKSAAGGAAALSSMTEKKNGRRPSQTVPQPVRDGKAKLPQEVRDDLARSGLTQTDAHALDITAEADGYRIPYHDLDGKPTGFYRIRSTSGKRNFAGKVQRYSQPPRTGTHVHLPRFIKWRPIAGDPKKTVYITEGEKKAACAVKHHLPCIGLGGVDSWRGDAEKELEEFMWEGREVVICFDSDAASNPNIRRAEAKLAEHLRGKGARVLIKRLPQGEDGSKVGIDDFIVAHGVKAFKQLPVIRDQEHEAPQLVRVDMREYHTRKLDEVQYAVEPILPRGVVTLLSGHGGSGKSIVAETLALHVACGQPVMGLAVLQGPALYVSLEDPAPVVVHRAKRITERDGLDPKRVIKQFTVLDGADSDGALAVETNEFGTRGLQFTDALAVIEAAAEGCALIVIDNASDAFSGDENSRRQVRGFIRRLGQMARKHNAALLLLGHVDKAAARGGSNGNHYSGSTAWNNSVRSRLALVEDKSGRVVLTHEKSNLTKRAEPITLQWTSGGVLVPVDASAATANDAQDDAAVLYAIQKAVESGVNVPTGRVGAVTALSALLTLPDLPDPLRKDRQRFWAALSRLERGQLVQRETYRGPDRHERARLIACGGQPPVPPVISRRTGRRAITGAANSDSPQSPAARIPARRRRKSRKEAA